MIAYLTADGLSPRDRALLKLLLRTERVVFEHLKDVSAGPPPSIDEHAPILGVLEAILDGRYPTPDVLEHMPILRQWRIGIHGFSLEPCLIGLVEGHPEIQGPQIRTSRVFVIAAEFGWARTASRFYRLGRPYTEGSA